ncbi:MAG: tRNA pseudouridine(55) synthase TruB [Acidobacteria bacterium]|nr:tRNA pseudouridine(55) synthase TruB [Acidobacteriota bacterium]
MKNQIYLIDKPSNMTSFDVVQTVRKAIGIRRVGHAGTLDPFATGLLIVASGPFTRLVDLFHHYPKTYLATFQLGVSTDTDDMTGTVQAEKNISGIREPDILSALSQFEGEITQRPPAISAKRVDGKRLYRVNREGVKVEARPVKVQVHEIRSIEVELPCVTMEIECGTGTYIRSIARDLGEILGVGGAVKSLSRTAIGPYKLSDAYNLTEIEPIPHLSILPELESFSLASDAIEELSSGKSVLLRDVFLDEGQKIRIFDDYFKKMRALCRVTMKGSVGCRIQPEKVFSA